MAVHCDSNVIHSPGTCRYCDLYGKPHQIYLLIKGINFTNTEDPDKLPCPSTKLRSVEQINRWGGNVPVGHGEDDPVYLFPADWEKMDTLPKEQCDLPPKGWYCKLEKGHTGS